MSNTTYKKDLHDIALAIANSTKTYVDNADNNLQSQIDGINAGQNCADIVADLIALENYDVTNLEVGDKIEVLEDEQHEDASTVYSFNGTTRPSGTEGVDWWQGADGTYYEYVGRFGGDSYTKADINTMMALKADKSTTYTKTETDTLLGAKADLTNNAQVITADKMYVNEIRGVDGSSDIKTTYNIQYKLYETKVKGTQGFADNFGVICQHSYSSLYREYYISGGTTKKEGFEVNRQETKITKGDNTLKIDYTTNKLTYNNNEIIDTANATTELFLTDGEMATLLSEVFD